MDGVYLWALAILVVALLAGAVVALAWFTRRRGRR